MKDTHLEMYTYHAGKKAFYLHLAVIFALLSIAYHLGL